MFGSNKNDIRFSLIEKKLEKIEQTIIELALKMSKEEEGMELLKKEFEIFKNQKEVKEGLQKMKEKEKVVAVKGRKPKN